MPFPRDVRDHALVKSHRRCCVCHEFGGRSAVGRNKRSALRQISAMRCRGLTYGAMPVGYCALHRLIIRAAGAREHAVISTVRLSKPLA